MKYAFIHANLFDSVNGEMLENRSVLVDGDKIESVIEGDKIPAGYEVRDLNGGYLLPGLINLHAHFFGTGQPSKILGGGSLQKLLMKIVHTKLGEPITDVLVRGHAKASLLSGVTTVRSSGDFVYSDVRIRDEVKAGKTIGPRMIVPGPAITCVGGHGDGTFSMTSDDPAELVRFVEENAKHNVDMIKICVTGGVMDAKVKGEPGETKMTLEQTKAVCDKAHELGMKVASHTESSHGVKVALEGGVDTIEHGSFLDEELISLFKEKGSAFIVTISPALPLAKLPVSITKLNELCLYNADIVLNGIIEGGKKALENNIPVGIGTDESCPLVTPYSMWREVYYFSKHCGVTNAFALQTATLKNAEIAGISDITGSIEAGKSADMIVVRRNPLEDLTALRNIETIMSQGKLYEHPEVKKNAQIEEWLDSLM